MKTLILIPTELEAVALRRLWPDAPIRITGVGMAETAAHTARIIVNEHPDRLLMVGIAGAYRKSMRIGEVYAVAREKIHDIPEHFFTAYESTWTLDGFPTGNSNTTNGIGLPDAGSDLENMEGAAFMAVCCALGVPCAELRAVSNYTDDPYESWHTDEAVEALAQAVVKVLRS